MTKERGSLAIAVIILFIVFIVFCNPVTIVGVGQRGVKETWGTISEKSFNQGVHFVVPVFQKMHVMNVKTQKLSTPTEVYTKDIQQARISYVVNYNLMPENAWKMYQEVGKNYVDTILMPAIEGNIKDVIGRWNAQDLVANRAIATADILTKLQAQLKDRYINVTSFQIIDINYSETVVEPIVL